MKVPLITPEPPDPLVEETRLFWRETGRELIRTSINSIDETAKQLIGIAGILEGLYFHAITFSNLYGKIANPWIKTIYLMPIGLLLISLSAALSVFFPYQYRFNLHSSDASREIYEIIVKRKLLLLRIASTFLVLGIASLFIVILTYLQGS